MNVLVALCFVTALGNLLKDERGKVARLRELLREKQELLGEMERELSRRGVEIPENFTSEPDSFTPYFKFKASVQVPGNIQCFDFTEESSLVVFTTKGELNVFDARGKLVFSTELGIKDIPYCSAFASTDRILIAYLHSNHITVSSLILNQESLNPIYTQIHSGALFNGTTGPLPTAFTDYVRMGKKYWVVGDSQGGISLYSDTGEFKDRGLTGLSTITSLDRVSQQLIFAGDKTTGVYNLGAMEIYLRCEDSLSPMYSSVLDYSTTIIYGGLENGDIIVYDTKYSINNSPVTCKPIARLVNRYTSKHSLLATSEHFLLSWNGEIFTAFNNSCLEGGMAVPPYHYTVKDLVKSPKSSLRSFKTTQANSIIGISAGNSLMIFELLSSTMKTAPLAAPGDSEFGIDFGYIRIAAIIIGIFVVVFYRMKNKKSPAQTEVEKLERSLEDLQHSVDKGGNMQKRLHKIEEETTKTVRFAEKHDTYQYSSDED